MCGSKHLKPRQSKRNELIHFSWTDLEMWQVLSLFWCGTLKQVGDLVSLWVRGNVYSSGAGIRCLWSSPLHPVGVQGILHG